MPADVALNRRAEVGNRPRVCILALSAIADDPRVRRQGDAFARGGWDVVGVGLPGAGSALPNRWRKRRSEPKTAHHCQAVDPLEGSIR